MAPLTVLVAGLSEGLPLGENDGHSQILEGRHVEKGGVLVVLDVLVVHVGLVSFGRHPGNVAGTASRGEEEGGGGGRGKEPMIFTPRTGSFPQARQQEMEQVTLNANSELKNKQGRVWLMKTYIDF